MQVPTTQGESDVSSPVHGPEPRPEAPSLFRLMADRIPGTVWAVDIELRFTASFGAALRELNLLPNQVVGRTLYEYFETTDDAFPAIAAHRRALQGESADFEIRWFRRHFQTHVEPLRDDHGQIIGCVGFARDATESQQLIDALEESEHQYRLLADSIPQIVFRCDPQGELLDFNRRWYEYTGQTPDQAHGQGYAGAIHPDDLEDLYRRGREAAKDGRLNETEYRLRRADGSYRWHLSRALPSHDSEGRVVSWFGSVTDIDDRKRAELALRASEQRYRLLAESTTDFVFIVDHQGTLQYVNQSAASRFGVPPRELAGKGQIDLFPPDLVHKHLQAIEQVFRSGSPYEEDETIPFGSSAVWLNIRLLPLRDDREQITAVMGVCRDVSDRKRAEELRRNAHEDLERQVKRRTADLRRSNEQLQHEVEERREAQSRLAMFQRLVEEAGQVFSTAGLDGRITYMNAFGCQLLGKPIKEIVGTSLFDFYAGEDRERLEHDVLPSVLADGKWTGELYLTTAAGVRFEAVQHLFLVRETDEGSLRLATVITDITGLRAAQEALRHGEERYQTLVEACPDAVVMVDLNLRITFASSRAVELYGAGDAAELCGQDIGNLVADHERQRLLANLPRLLQEGLRRNTEYELRRKDGSTFAGEVSTAVVRDARGQPRVLVAIVRDITERKLAEEALNRERQNLWHMLRSSDHERQMIAYEIHDGLAQQLAGALLQFQSYEYQKDRHAQRAREDFEAGLTALRQAHFEARRLISGVRPPILDEYGIDAALAHLVNEKALTAPPQVEYESEIGFGRLAPILENTIYRIAQEALTNACQHSHSAEVRVRLVQDGHTVRLEVCDTGVGFDPKSVVDQRFGLKGIKERTRMLDGQLTIDSAAGQGTTIRVVLPLLERQEALSEGAP